MSAKHTCPQCGGPMDAYEQPGLLPTDAPTRYETCFNRTCPLEGVTLLEGAHALLSPALVAAYDATRRKVTPQP